MRVYFVVNSHRADAVASAAQTARWALNEGWGVGTDPESGRVLSVPVVRPEDFGEADIVVAFGGDGTLIRASHLVSEWGVPVLGVYYGRFGFVTQCSGEDVHQCLQRFADKKLKIEDRMMLASSLARAGHELTALHALNEVVIQRSVTARMMTFRIAVDGVAAAAYPADGVIVSTPTGSTAYNLSAGGPIVEPSVSAFIVTPLAPHTLSARPLVLPPSSTVTMSVESDGDSVVSVDGQTRLHLLSDDVVQVSVSKRVTRLVVVEEADFLTKLGQRLFFSRGINMNP